MEGLRLILLAFGAIVVAGVWLYSRRTASSSSGHRDEPNAEPEQEPRVILRDVDEEIPDSLPRMNAVDDDDGNTDQEVVIATPRSASRPPEARSTRREHEPKIIVLNILPRDEISRFAGADLLDVFDRAGLEYGQYNVFHRIKESAEGAESVFSVASATEPGSFDITTMAEESFRGVTLFMQLPGPVRGVDAFADMLATARRIAEQIRGEVKDRNRSTLTRQTAHHIREEIIAFEHRLQLVHETGN